MARFRFIEEQIAEIERERLRRLEDGEPRHSPTNAMVRLLSRVVGLGVETADMLWCTRSSRAIYGIVEPLPAMPD